MGNILRSLSLCLVLLLLGREVEGSNNGKKGFNPGSDIAWDCIYPIEVEGTCVCCYGNYCRYGVKMTYWEPIGLLEVVRCKDSSPVYGEECKKDANRSSSGGGGNILDWWGTGSEEGEQNKYYVHYIKYPVFYLFQLFDYLCLEIGDIAYLYKSEWDSSWNYEDESFQLFPEASLLGTWNYILPTCGADCIISSLPYGFSNETFITMHLAQAVNFGCMGCWGVTYPVAGQSTTKVSDVTTSGLLAARIVHKLHRLGLLMSNYEPNYCYYHPWIWIDRAQYKFQLAYPVKSSKPTTCFPVGFIPFAWEYVKKYPGHEGEWIYVLWRLTKCCLL